MADIKAKGGANGTPTPHDRKRRLSTVWQILKFLRG